MRTAQPWKTNRARILRANETSAEEKLWQESRGRRMEALKFIRQAPVGPYFVDFLCRKQKIAIEVDGGTRSTESELAADAKREPELRRLGYRVFRAWNNEIYENVDGVIDSLIAFVDEGG